MNGASTNDLTTLDVNLKNNPFLAPGDGRCIINDLPAELLSQIFVFGAGLGHDEESSDEDEDDGTCSSLSDIDSDDGSDCSQKSLSSDDERHLPFELLVTRICRRWREVAVEIPSLWSDIIVTPESKIDKAEEYVRRAKGAPLDISVDCTVDYDDEDEDGDNDRWETESAAARQPESKPLVDILDILIPHVHQWKTFELLVSHYFPMLYALKKLSECESAPMLEALELYHYEDDDDAETFHPAKYKNREFVLFHNNLPKLKRVALWGVHLDWKTTTFLSNLHDVELAYHTLDVRPSYRDFLRILKSSPQLHTLTLCQSGPAGMPVQWLESVQADTDSTSPADPVLDIFLPSVVNLVLAFLPPDYALALLERMHLPNVTSLALDFEQDEYRPVVDFLCKPGSGTSKSLLAGVEALKLSGLPCSHTPSVINAAKALTNMKQISVNFNHVDHVWFDLLRASANTNLDDFPTTPGAAGATFFPSLEAISITGLSGEEVKVIVAQRKEAGKPLKEVYLNREEHVDPDDQVWFERNLELFERFEGSDDEDDEDMDDALEFGLSDVDEDGIAEDDHDEDWTDEDGFDDDDNYDDDDDDDIDYELAVQLQRWH